MDVEIELRAKIINRDKLRKKLQSLGAKFLKSHVFFNTYHGLSFFKDQDIQIRVSDAYCLSEREWEFYVGYKGPDEQKGANVREEIDEQFGEIEGPSRTLTKLGIKNIFLDSTSQVRNILEQNGFEFFMAMVGDNDERFNLGDLDIKLMSLPQMALELIEVERVAHGRQLVNKIREEIWQFMKSLRITKDNLIEKEPVQLIYQHYN